MVKKPWPSPWHALHLKWRRLAKNTTSNFAHQKHEPTAYPSLEKAGEHPRIGGNRGKRKLIVRDGPRGPKKIGVNGEFFRMVDWSRFSRREEAIIELLVAYGPILATWLNAEPNQLHVTAVAQQFQQKTIPKVRWMLRLSDLWKLPSDSRTILELGNCRKDMENLRLGTGAIYADNGKDSSKSESQPVNDGFEEQKL